MRRWHGLGDVPDDWGRSVVTVGVFDGVHRGHQRLVRRAVEIAAERGLPSVAVTFDPNPADVVRPGTAQTALCSLTRRLDLLAGLGVDAAVIVPFSTEFAALSAADFVRLALVDRLHAVAVVVGENFRFGHAARGDLAELGRLGEAYGFAAEGVAMVADGEAISSSGVRDLVAEGDVEGATRMLGRPHRVEGVVVRGHRRGRALGFPTANVESPEHTAVPLDGVYAGWLQCIGFADVPPDYNGERWPAAISIGTNPQFDGAQRTVEAYVLDRDDLDLYGTHVGVDFAVRLRDTMRFDSIESLVKQIQGDADATRSLLLGRTW